MSRFGGAMKISTAFLASAIICVTLPMTMATAADAPPRWAYIEDNPNYQTLACAVCHGPDLRGLGPLPSIAGRSPSYMFRQLYDFAHGHRAGEWSPLMAQVVGNLDQDDMLAIVAYLASLDP
jgi:cytochrome c553